MVRPIPSRSAARFGPMPLRKRSGCSSARSLWLTERLSEDWAPRDDIAIKFHCAQSLHPKNLVKTFKQFKSSKSFSEFLTV